MLPDAVEDFSSLHRQSWPSNLVREKTTVLLVSVPRIRSQMLQQMRDHG